MSIYHFLNLLFYAEVLVLVLTAVFILFKRCWDLVGPHNAIKSRKYLSKIISDAYLKNKPIVFNKSFYKENLLKVLEEFSHKFSGDDWDRLKLEVIEKYLLVKARKLMNSIFWMKRMFAARVFAICSLNEDKNRIIKLFDDKNYLVSSIAAIALIKIGDIKGIEKVLKKLSVQQGYYHYFYLDLLSKGSLNVLQKIDHIAKKKDFLHPVCLEVLALQNQILDFGYLEKDLKSKDEKIVISALKIVIRDPLEKWEELLLHLIDSPNIEIKLLAIKALANYPSKKSIKALNTISNKGSIDVKIQAAFSLKSLDLIDHIKDEIIKSYVLNFES